MPILNSILDHDVLGPAILQGRQEGRQEVVRQLITKRFGSVPAAVDERLCALSGSELDAVAIRLLDAKRLEDVFE